MAVPFFRELENTDDGCSEYECLSCEATWECRSFGTRFCGHCGIRWEGLMQSSQASFQRQGWAYDIEEAERKSDKPSYKWACEKRWCFVGSAFQSWEHCPMYLRWEHTRKDVLDAFKDELAKEAERENDWSEMNMIVQVRLMRISEQYSDRTGCRERAERKQVLFKELVIPYAPSEEE